ncbi:hypothetical protein ACT691_05575 [Vibrio metschnikovii]
MADRNRAGEVLEGYLQSQIVRDERAEGGPLVFALPSGLAWGYHTLLVTRKRRKALVYDDADHHAASVF